MAEALWQNSILRHDRCHDGIDCRDQIRHLQPDLKSSLAAVDIDEVVGERLLFDYRRVLRVRRLSGNSGNSGNFLAARERRKNYFGEVASTQSLERWRARAM